MPTPTLRQSVGAAYTDGFAHHAVSTEMNSLANNAPAVSSIINGTGVMSNNAGDGQGNGCAAFKMCLHLAVLGGNPAANSCIDGWWLDEADGSNYDSGSASITPARPPDFAFPLDSSRSTAQVVTIYVAPPVTAAFKVLTRNNALGVSLASSGSYIDIYPVTETLPSV